jgi:hypothetical protein
MKIVWFCVCFDTFSKMSLTFFSDSPTYMFISSGPFTLRKFNEHSVATAFANNVWKIYKTNNLVTKFHVPFGHTHLLENKHKFNSRE